MSAELESLRAENDIVLKTKDEELSNIKHQVILFRRLQIITFNRAA